MSFGNVLQRDGRTYALVPRVPLGLITSDQLRALADLADKYQVEAIKFTGEQRVTLIGFREDQLDQAWADLGMEPGAAKGLCVHGVKACPGTEWCRFGVQDSIELGLELEKRYHGMETPGKFKIGVSGCPFSCPEPAVKDLGIKGTKQGWTVMVGGTAGAKPRLADTIAENLSTEDALNLSDRILKTYVGSVEGRRRIGRWIDEIGLEDFKSRLSL